MLLHNNKKLLIYGFNDEEKKLIEEIINENTLPEYKVMDKSMAQMKIRDIVEGLNLQVLDNSLPEERVILFNNLSDDELERAIKAMKNKFEQAPILAVVTPTSIEWTLKTLVSHLIEEKNWFKQRNM